MARIRTIKPEFFRHEQLQDLEIAHPGSYVMLVFAALPGHCDKAGHFEWKPRTLKLDILPFITFELAETLNILHRAGFIKRYKVGEKEYGEIPTFADHQRISGKEAAEPEKHPKPTEYHQGSNGEAPEKHPESQEGKGRERKGKDITAPKVAEVVSITPKPLTPLQAVMRAYKVGKGIKANDAAWDADQYPRHVKAAAKLLRAFKNDDKAAVTYLLGKAQEWDESGVKWVLATIASHAWDERGKLGIGQEAADAYGAGIPHDVGQQAGQMGADRPLDAGRSSRITQARTLAIEALQQFGSDHQRPHPHDRYEPQEQSSAVLGPEDAGQREDEPA